MPSQPAQQQPHLPHGFRVLSTDGPGAGQLQPGRISGLWSVSEPRAGFKQNLQAPGPNEQTLPSLLSVGHKSLQFFPEDGERWSAPGGPGHFCAPGHAPTQLQPLPHRALICCLEHHPPGATPLGLQQQLDGLDACLGQVMGEEDSALGRTGPTLAVKRYFQGIHVYLKENQSSDCAWEIVRVEIMRSFSSSTNLQERLRMMDGDLNSPWHDSHWLRCPIIFAHSSSAISEDSDFCFSHKIYWITSSNTLSVVNEYI